MKFFYGQLICSSCDKNFPLLCGARFVDQRYGRVESLLSSVDRHCEVPRESHHLGSMIGDVVPLAVSTKPCNPWCPISTRPSSAWRRANMRAGCPKNSSPSYKTTSSSTIPMRSNWTQNYLRTIGAALPYPKPSSPNSQIPSKYFASD